MRPLSLRNSTIIALGILVALALTITGCSAGGSGGAPQGTGSSGGSTPPTTASGPTITEKDFAFSPATLTVKVGDVVTFVNEDSAPHNVSIDGAELGMQNQGASLTWTAAKAGDFPYSCVIHPAMTGTITVK